MKTWVLEGVEADALLSDRALTHGLGVFETLLAVNGRVVRPDLHFARMAAGCRRLGIEGPDESAILHGVEKELDRLAVPRARVRVMRTAGPGGLRELGGSSPRTVLSVGVLDDPPESMTVTTAPWSRNESSPLAGVKCSSYAEGLVALDHARRAGFDELVFPNTRGMLCEAATANAFVVLGRGVVTPPVASGCLPGTTRQRIIETGRELGIDVVERPVSMDEAREAAEMFLTSATRGVVPVSRWGDRAFGDREVGLRLRAAFDESLNNS